MLGALELANISAFFEKSRTLHFNYRQGVRVMKLVDSNYLLCGLCSVLYRQGKNSVSIFYLQPKIMFPVLSEYTAWPDQPLRRATAKVCCLPPTSHLPSCKVQCVLYMGAQLLPQTTNYSSAGVLLLLLLLQVQLVSKFESQQLNKVATVPHAYLKYHIAKIQLLQPVSPIFLHCLSLISIKISQYKPSVHKWILSKKKY